MSLSDEELADDGKRRYSVTLNKMDIEDLETLVTKGYFMSPQEAIRDALRHHFAYYGLPSHSDRRTREQEKEK